MFPLIPMAASAVGSALAGATGWMFVKYENMQSQMEMISAHTAQLQLSADSMKTHSIWKELLEPVAQRWGPAIKFFAYSVAGASSVVALIAVAFSREILQELRKSRKELSEVAALREEVSLLRHIIEDACPDKLRELDRARLERRLGTQLVH